MEFSKWHANTLETTGEESVTPKTQTIDGERLPTTTPTPRPTEPSSTSVGAARGAWSADQRYVRANMEFPWRNTAGSWRDRAARARSARRSPRSRFASIIVIRPAESAVSSARGAILRSGFAVIVRPWCEQRWSIWRLPVAMRKPVGRSGASSEPAQRPRNPHGEGLAGEGGRIAFRQVSDQRNQGGMRPHATPPIRLHANKI
jgi:hypothetical protein